jgi:hypothetical protein
MAATASASQTSTTSRRRSVHQRTFVVGPAGKGQRGAGHREQHGEYPSGQPEAGSSGALQMRPGQVKTAVAVIEEVAGTEGGDYPTTNLYASRRTVNPLTDPTGHNFLYASSRPACGGRPPPAGPPVQASAVIHSKQ